MNQKFKILVFAFLIVVFFQAKGWTEVSASFFSDSFDSYVTGALFPQSSFWVNLISGDGSFHNVVASTSVSFPNSLNIGSSGLGFSSIQHIFPVTSTEGHVSLDFFVSEAEDQNCSGLSTQNYGAVFLSDVTTASIAAVIFCNNGKVIVQVGGESVVSSSSFIFGTWNHVEIDYLFDSGSFTVLMELNASESILLQNKISFSETVYALSLFGSRETLNLYFDNVEGSINEVGPLGISFYSQIKNTPAGVLTLRNLPNASAQELKKLPEDWVVRVDSTTDEQGDSVIADGYYWYKVTDPTDGVYGWMAGKEIVERQPFLSPLPQQPSASHLTGGGSGVSPRTIQYLPYVASDQLELELVSSSYIATSSRPNLILGIFDHYYNNASTSYSLYSSDDGDNDISILKDRNFEKKVLWGMAAVESGGVGFNNQHVTFDYGHGIMMPTFNAHHFEITPPFQPHATWDNRGYGSKIKIIPCKSVGSDLYTNCYLGAGSGSDLIKPYKPYAGISINPTYKQYTNTKQSVYANIKDGLRVLQDKLYNNLVCDTRPDSLKIDFTVFTCLDREIILSTAQYNGTSTYLHAVADKLDNIDNYFPGQTASDISKLIGKMDLAGDHSVYVQLLSPGDLSVLDSNGKVVGMVDGTSKNEFPFASYDPQRKSVQIFFPSDDSGLIYKVVGTGTGVYGLIVTITEGDQVVTFRAKDIPIVPSEVHSYRINKESLLSGKNGVNVEIDSDGDGVADQVFETGVILTGSDFLY